PTPCHDSGARINHHKTARYGISRLLETARHALLDARWRSTQTDTECDGIELGGDFAWSRLRSTKIWPSEFVNPYANRGPDRMLRNTMYRMKRRAS
ncbi:MAG: hypothetical protein ACI9W2_002497, partial [Gammaproteobacteria bacterium]